MGLFISERAVREVALKDELSIQATLRSIYNHLRESKPWNLLAIRYVRGPLYGSQKRIENIQNGMPLETDARERAIRKLQTSSGA